MPPTTTAPVHPPRSLLAICRVAGLPSIVSTTLVAILLTAGFYWPGDGSQLLWSLFQFLLPIILACSFYLGGCLLGASTDARHHAPYFTANPDRPQALSPSALSLIGYLLLIMPWFLGSFYSVIEWLLIYRPDWSIIRGILSTPQLLLELVDTRQLVISSLLLAFILCYSWISGHLALQKARNPAYQPSPVPITLFILAPLTIAFLAHVIPNSIEVEYFVLAAVAAAFFLAHCIFSLKILSASLDRFLPHILGGYCFLDAIFVIVVDASMFVVCLLLYVLTILLNRITPTA